MVQFWQFVNDIKCIVLMAGVQVSFAGVNILYKLAAIHGMNLRVLVAYRILFAAAFIVPLAYFLERKSRPKLTWTVLGQAFLTGLFGGSLVQNLYLESLVLTSATYAAAMANLVPAVTFILAVFFRLEKVSLKSLSGRAKIMGTLLGIGGAMLLTFYKGVEIKLWPTNVHLLKHTANGPVLAHHAGRDRLVGSILALAGCFSYAAWLIVQAKMSVKYPSPYSSTALMTIMGSIQAVVFALCTDRDLEQWKLGWDIRLLTVAYSGCIASGAMVTLVAWCIRIKGPLFVSVFNPLTLILVALAGSLFLNEKLYLGSVLGAILIVFGLYGVIWGKGKEIKKMTTLVPTMTCDNSIEAIEIVTSSVLDEGSKASKDIEKNASTGPDCATKEENDQSIRNDGIAAQAESRNGAAG